MSVLTEADSLTASDGYMAASRSSRSSCPKVYDAVAAQAADKHRIDDPVLTRLVEPREGSPQLAGSSDREPELLRISGVRRGQRPVGLGLPNPRANARLVNPMSTIAEEQMSGPESGRGDLGKPSMFASADENSRGAAEPEYEGSQFMSMMTMDRIVETFVAELNLSLPVDDDQQHLHRQLQQQAQQPNQHDDPDQDRQQRQHHQPQHQHQYQHTGSAAAEFDRMNTACSAISGTGYLGEREVELSPRPLDELDPADFNGPNSPAEDRLQSRSFSKSAAPEFLEDGRAEEWLLETEPSRASVPRELELSGFPSGFGGGDVAGRHHRKSSKELRSSSRGSILDSTCFLDVDEGRESEHENVLPSPTSSSTPGSVVIRPSPAPRVLPRMAFSVSAAPARGSGLSESEDTGYSGEAEDLPASRGQRVIRPVKGFRSRSRG